MRKHWRTDHSPLLFSTQAGPILYASSCPLPSCAMTVAGCALLPGDLSFLVLLHVPTRNFPLAPLAGSLRHAQESHSTAPMEQDGGCGQSAREAGVVLPLVLAMMQVLAQQFAQSQER